MDTPMRTVIVDDSDIVQILPLGLPRGFLILFAVEFFMDFLELAIGNVGVNLSS